MNDILKHILTNNCCYDKDKTPIIPGDVVCYSYDNKIYVSPVFKTNSNNNKIKVIKEEHKYTFFVDAYNTLNISKKYNVNPIENYKIIKEKFINTKLQQRNLKYIFGYGYENNKKIIFQLLINKNNNIIDVLKNKCKHLQNIFLFSKNEFIKTDTPTLIHYNKPFIISNEEFFIPTKVTIPSRAINSDFFKFYIIEYSSKKEISFNQSNNKNIKNDLIINTFYNNKEDINNVSKKSNSLYF